MPAAQIHPWLAALGVLMLVAVLAEAAILLTLGRPYCWRSAAASLGVAGGRRLLEAALGGTLAAPVLAVAWEHRVTTQTLATPVQWLLLFLLHELAYYAFHRASHRVRWCWATHAVHHSPAQLTLATALRLGWTGRLSGSALFFAPLVAIGFAPEAVGLVMALDLAWQFWLHTTWTPHLGPLEWVLNTPAHHRVHHASNAEYLDANYGGVLIVFDRLFGSFRAERPDVPLRYGLTTPLNSFNPVRIACHEWLNLARDLVANPVRAWPRLLFGPPGSTPARPASPPQPCSTSRRTS